MSTHIEQFRYAMQRRGIIPPAHIAVGKIDRADVEGEHGRGDASYIFFEDGIAAGGFENHKDGAGWENWRADIGRQLAPAELLELRERAEVARLARDAEQAKRRAVAAAFAATLWQTAQPAPEDHAYLTRKGIAPCGARVYEGGLEICGLACTGALMVPLRDSAGALHTLAFIAANGEKRFLLDGAKRQHYYAIGRPKATLCIAEGFATGASVYAATGLPVAIAFDAGNLQSVALTLRVKYSTAKLIVCVDDDHRTAGNPGMAKAIAAARAVGGFVAVPDFGPDRPDDAKDFNDLMKLRGPEAVQDAIAHATAPDGDEAQPKTQNTPGVDSGGPTWPSAMNEAAMHGIAGEFVRMVEPDTEADPAAILVQVLAAFGALVGRGPHYRVEGDQHHANLYVLLVGKTAKARKGTSWGRVRAPFEGISDWKAHVSGLSSGEGLKYNVRDAREETRPNKNNEMVTKVTDDGVTDKRLLVVEPEFANVLRVAQRPGNTLSATIREAWDTGNLRTLTKNDPVTATGAHVCVIAHVTDDELRTELTATDSANGFANRFLFVAVKRSKELPFGGDEADEHAVNGFAERFRERATLARTRRRITMTENARKVWAGVYADLSAGGDGLHGAVTARAEAQVIRIALIYSLLDGGEHIDVPHLFAGLAIWNYCNESAKYIFGASLGDRTADEIMRRLQQAGDGGMTRTDISKVFTGHLSASKIGPALDLLKRKGRASCETVKTEGRPVEVWRAVKY